ncbi:MAG: lipopolysaccharide biosynthesis protein [Proteobacteria bacterium]|nr:lipopolysaccharide biosynthesis protein [Pseudomonadota bacterium]MBU1736842.1 lipopolysaccharide biosynthesis protein [Pseudomonadota bacterium]
MTAVSSTTLPAAENGFFRNTMTLVGGNVVARIITFGLAPLITRLYSPEVFGTFSLLLAVAEVFVAISCLRYNNTILLPKNDADADNIVALCIFLVATTSLVCLIAILTAPAYLATVLNLGAPTLLFFIPLLILVSGIQQITDMWFLRLKHFNRLATSKIIAAVTDRSLSISLGLIASGVPTGLLTGRVAGVFCSTVALFVVGLQPLKDVWTSCNIRRILEIAGRYRIFPKYVGDAFIQRASVQAPLLLIGFFFGPLEAGLYALTQRILGEPMTLIGDSLGRSYSQKASEHYRNGESVAGDTRRLYRYSLIYFGAPMIFMSFILSDLFGLIFGTKWMEAGIYVKLLTPVFIVIFAIRPISIIYDLHEKQKERLLHNTVSLAVICLSFTVGAWVGRPVPALVLYAVSITLLAFWRIGWLMKLCGTPWRDFFGITFDSLKWPLYILGSIILVNISPFNRYLIFYCLAATSLYLVVMAGNDPFISAGIKAFFRQTTDRITGRP